MLKSDRSIAALLLVMSVTPALAGTKRFPWGHSYYVSCTKLAVSPGKEDVRPGLDELSFGFSDTQRYQVDLIVGPVRSDEEQVVFSDLENTQRTGWVVSLSRATGVLTIRDGSGSKEAKYLCERSSPYGTTF